MLSVNPFDDPQIKKQILDDAGVVPLGEDDYEEVHDLSSFENIISSTPVIPDKAGNTIKTIIRDAGSVVKEASEEKAQQMNLALNDVFTKFNEQYNLSLHVDMSNFTKTLVACSDVRNQKILELFVSRVVRSIFNWMVLYK